MRVHFDVKRRRAVHDDDDDDDDDGVVFGFEDPSRNLLKHWNFDSDDSDSESEEQGWRVRRDIVRKSPDTHSGRGTWSMKMNSEDFETLTLHRVHHLKRNTNYYFSLFLKFLSETHKTQDFEVTIFVAMKMRHEDELNKSKIAIMPYMEAPGPRNAVWKQCGGTFKTPDSNSLEYVETQLSIKPHDVVFLLDMASLIELKVDKQWKKTTDRRIERFRKSNVKLSVSLPEEHRASDYTVQIRQTKRKFGIGAAISADEFNEESEFGANYRKCFFDHFEWAVFNNDTKWKPMESVKGEINFERVDKALEKLQERGIPVRGHAIHWNKKDNNPEWVQELEGKEFQAELMRRVNYVMNHFKDSNFIQWDVCNEHLQNRYFEERGGNPNQIKALFDRAHKLDPDVDLYLNDYLIFRGGLKTSSQYNLARWLLEGDSPVHGIGVQSHLRHLPIDFEVLKKRAEVIAAAGLPVMVTELSLHSDDVSIRAEYLDKALRLFFSIPKVVGVIFWLFSDQPGITMDENDMSLFDGPDFEPNEAGKALKRLLKKWQTNESFTKYKHHYDESFRAFHGEYMMEVLRNGELVTSEKFVVKEKRDMDIKLKILA